jgi:hypothetical protein
MIYFRFWEVPLYMYCEDCGDGILIMRYEKA